MEAQAQILIDRRTDALGNLQVLPDEILCTILERLTPRDAARVACVSSVMYILCNEEPLWMSLCLKGASGLLQYKGSWKKTALHNENLPDKYKECQQRPLHFDGFNSLFLYRRLYRCHTTLDAFYTEGGNVERINGISLEDFYNEYDVKKPVGKWILYLDGGKTHIPLGDFGHKKECRKILREKMREKMRDEREISRPSK